MLLVKNLPEMQETQDTIADTMATHPSILAWIISWTVEAVGLQSIGLHGVSHS